MKKLAIMFVMLLGSVATMQAQSFDFSCVQASNVFDATQVEELVMGGFTQENPSLFETTSEDGLYSVMIELDGGSFIVYIPGVSGAVHEFLVDAIAAAIAAAAEPNPDADNDGILDAHEVTLNDPDDYGFVEFTSGEYRWTRADGKYTSLIASGLFIEVAGNGYVIGEPLYTVAEYDNTGMMVDGPWNGSIGDSIGTSTTLFNR